MHSSFENLLIIKSFDKKALPQQRQETIDYLIRQHKMNRVATKSLRYDTTLQIEGQNVSRNICIGPLAFSDNSAWLANVIFHELIHSDQFHWYEQKGVNLVHREIDSEISRLMLALDEFEGYYWCYHNRSALGLNASQAKKLHHEKDLYSVDIDDEAIMRYVRRMDFYAARDLLIKRLHKG
jgi:hypothetical protein